ncbi:MAG TPA: alpha-2-macroglobulin family protein [Candidatus Limnocylindria bacterium]|nr:alpha-2-macroglobulin family protein [Candidatus Limnocylindria bacterium]
MMPFRWMIWTLALCSLVIFSQAATWEEQQRHAEAFYAEGSFVRAWEIYRQAPGDLSGSTNRWVQFRVNDTLWRTQGENLRNEESERALSALDRVFPQQAPEIERDRAWAEAMESLGDFHDRRGDARDWVETRYGFALDWWSGRSELTTARNRYLAIIWKLARNRWNRMDPESMPIRLDWLNNAVQIATEPADQAHARFLRARALQQMGPPDERALYLVEDDFKAALAGGKANPWHDAALFSYANWVEAQGKLILPKDASWYRAGDAARALPLYLQLTTEYKEGESAFWRQALDRQNEIVRESVDTLVPGVFLPGSEIQFVINARNVSQLNYVITSVDLTRQATFRKNSNDGVEWTRQVDIPVGPSQPSFLGELTFTNAASHELTSTNIVLPQKLPAGAYLLEITAGKNRTQDILLVSDATLTLHHSGKKVLAWFTDAMTGEPIPEANLQFWAAHRVDNGTLVRRSVAKSTDSHGLAEFNLEFQNEELVVFARSGSRQAFATHTTYYADRPGSEWKIYVATDRPAYRPKDVGHWKLIAREQREGRNTNPAGKKIYYEITDPRGARMTNGVIEFNAFGTSWGDFQLGETAPLGQYSILFWDQAEKRRHLGSSVLFRLEEYKLPEFEVKVALPEETAPDGTRRKKTFKLGESIEVNIQAGYYSGGAVKDAQVEVLVHQSEWHPIRPLDLPYPWYYTPAGGFGRGGFRGWRAPDQVVKRETLRTDAEGKAKLTLTTDPAGNDLEFRVEARVTDASRREITGDGEVRVTRQRYFVEPARHLKLAAPGSKATAGFRAYDANNSPVSVTGEVTITRERWDEVWLDPKGKEVRGAELALLKRKTGTWPPLPGNGERPWRLKFQGYRRDDIATQTIKTGTNGLGEVSFVPKEDGYYRLAWRSAGNATAPAPPDGRPRPFEPDVITETGLWIGSAKSQDLGYHGQGVEIIVDKETAQEGSRLPLAIMCDSPDRYVLLTVETGDRLDYSVLHLKGTVQFMDLDLADRHVPNFWLMAESVANRAFYQATEEIVVPPRKQFLTVEVKANRENYTPRDEGLYTITTRDDTGKPVSAEVALSVIDESITYIQPDLAGDPRPFFYGYRRLSHGESASTVQQRSYVRYLKSKAGEVYDEQAGPAEGDDEKGGEEGGGKYPKNITPIPAALDSVSLSGGAFGGAGSRSVARFGYAHSASPAVALGAVMKSARAELSTASGLAAAEPAGSGSEPNIVVRSDFRDTAFWQPNVTTTTDGSAQVKVAYPDSLTRWKATARAVTRENQVGMGSNAVQTQQPLMVRLQTPRFLTVGDLCVVSAVIENQTGQEVSLTPKLEVEGATITGGWSNGQFIKTETGPIIIASHGQNTAHWAVHAATNGSAKIRVTVAAGKIGDAMERTFPVYEHGIEKLEIATGKATTGDAGGSVVIPAARKAGSTTFTLNITPSLAATMLDALPYLADYPYGCTEQTLSRFLPAVIVRQTLQNQGLDAKTVMQKRFGGIETNFAAATHPGGPSDLTHLDDMIKAGLERLYDFQHADGGWGWWKEGESDPWMTAYVIWGWTLAAQADTTIDQDRLNRAVDWLRKHLVEAKDAPDLQTWELHALAAHLSRIEAKTFGDEVNAAFASLWSRRNDLNAYTRALFTTVAVQMGKKDESEVLLRNLENGVIKGNIQPWNPTATTASGGPQETAHWGNEGLYYRWSEGGIEATAFALRALLMANKSHALVEPVVTWLLKNRRGAQWNNTRDTAIVILVLNDYLRATKELAPDIEYAVEVNGREIAKADLRGKPLWDIARRFEVPSELIRDQNEFRIRRLNGTSPIYFSAAARYFSTEEPVEPAGNEIHVRREYVRLVGHPTLLKGLVYDRIPLRDGETVKSGERVEAIFTIASQNHYEYLLFEDLKPAGFEAAEVRSGGGLYARELKKSIGANPSIRPDSDSYTGASRWVYPEWRDRMSALFVDHLPEGYWELRVQYRAERPGQFHALPLIGQAMYVPEIRANSDETRLNVGE